MTMTAVTASRIYLVLQITVAGQLIFCDHHYPELRLKGIS